MGHRPEGGEFLWELRTAPILTHPLPLVALDFPSYPFSLFTPPLFPLLREGALCPCPLSLCLLVSVRDVGL